MRWLHRQYIYIYISCIKIIVANESVIFLSFLIALFGTREIRNIYREENAFPSPPRRARARAYNTHSHLLIHIYIRNARAYVHIHGGRYTYSRARTHTCTLRLSVISMEWLPSGLHPILGIAYFSNVYRNIGIILPSESDRMTGGQGEREWSKECVHEDSSAWMRDRQACV